MRAILSLVAALFVSGAALAQVGPAPGGCGAGAPCLPSNLGINGAVVPAIDLGVAGGTNNPTIYFETQANFAPYAQLEDATLTTQSGQSFLDDVLRWGFNRGPGGVKINAAAASIGLSLETDYWNSGVHALELNYDAQGPAFTTTTVGGTAASGGTLTLTATGSFAGSPHSVSTTASGGSTTTTLATALAAAAQADATFQAAGLTAYSSGAVVNMYNQTAAALAANVVWSKTTTGTATLTSPGAGTPWSTRPLAFGMDRDSGPDSPGYMNWTFRVGNTAGTSGFSIVNSDNTVHLLSVDGNNKGYVTIGQASGTTANLILASTNTPTLSMTNSTALGLIFSDAGEHFFFSSTDEFMLGTATDTRLARSGAGTLRVASSGSSAGVQITYFGKAVTVSSGCGTSPTLDASAVDPVGRITLGTTPGTSCVIAFAQTWSAAPACVANDNNATPIAIGASATTTLLTIRGAFTAGDIVSWHCARSGA